MNLTQIFDVLSSGGWVMIMLAIIAVLLYVTAFDLFYFVAHGNINSRSEKSWEDWIENPQLSKGRVGEILHYTHTGAQDEKSVRHRFAEVSSAIVGRVNRRLVFLNTLVAAAPLAGLLGTVMGMLSTFDGLSSGGDQTIGAISAGIKEALITTETGLMIALPGVFAALLIRRKKHCLEAAIARLESMLLVRHSSLDYIDI